MYRRSQRPCGIDEATEARAEIEWAPQDAELLARTDAKRITEDGAEAVALCYVSACAGWVVKRRRQQGERADWLLLQSGRGRALALEISGTVESDIGHRLREKRAQVSGCALPVPETPVTLSFGAYRGRTGRTSVHRDQARRSSG